MQDKNSLGYIRIAILRNEKLTAMQHIGIDKDRVAWANYNNELIRIENGVLSGLSNLKEKGRSSLFEDVLEAQRNAEFEIFRLNHIENKNSSTITALTDATRIKEATDYLKLVLQLHFPQEFPNPIVNEVLSQVEPQQQSQTNQSADISPEYNEILMSIVNRDELSRIDDTSGELDVLSGDMNYSDINFGLSLQEKRDGSFENYQPKVISLFEKYQAKLASEGMGNNQNTDNGQGGDPSSLDLGPAQ